VQSPGITQVQVHERAGLTFSRGLRAVLRQDPDVVLVGEIRDGETAELAVRASLTGHLVLTTMHTNGTVAAMTRFLEMGVEPFMVASSLSVVVAQRLVRRPCGSCAVADSPDPMLLRSLGVTDVELDSATPRRGTGCVECGDTGYRGRLGVFEVLPVDQRLRRVLAVDSSERAIADAADGLVTLRTSAVRRALQGQTTFEEVARVSPHP
jgi:type IV pilus assembly protein PilB